MGPVPMGVGHVAECMRDDRILAIIANADAAIERFVGACRDADVGCQVVRAARRPVFMAHRERASPRRPWHPAIGTETG